MANSASLRERFRLWAKSSPILAPVKRIIPDTLKSKLLKLAAGGRVGSISLGNDVILKYDLDDWYWPRYARNIRSYEPEMWFVADRYFSPDVIFIDCGANIGLWSCYAASKIKSRNQVIAVECGDSILPRLRQNRGLNGESFILLENAVWSRSGETKIFTVYRGHASSSLVTVDPNREQVHQIPVQTISIDDIVSRTLEKFPGLTNVIVKLDVEGVESEAVAGAKRTLFEKNTLLIYEDHGQDTESATTAFILQQGLKVYYVDISNSARRVLPVHNADELRAIKIDRGTGYNFLACRPNSRFDDDFQELL